MTQKYYNIPYMAWSNHKNPVGSQSVTIFNQKSTKPNQCNVRRLTCDRGILYVSFQLGLTLGENFFKVLGKVGVFELDGQILCLHLFFGEVHGYVAPGAVRGGQRRQLHVFCDEVVGAQLENLQGQ